MNAPLGLVLFAVLATLLALELRDDAATRSEPTPIGAASDTAAVEEPAPSAPALPALAALPDTTRRPLFLPGRTPPPPASAAEAVTLTPAVGPQPPALRLSAIVIRSGAPMAILARPGPGSGASLRVRVGERVDEWTVRAIEADRVVLVAGDRRHELPLRRYEPPPRPAKPPARRPPQPRAGPTPAPAAAPAGAAPLAPGTVPSQ